MIKVKNISKTFEIEGNDKFELYRNFNIEFPKKGLVFITGKSGCGKTTLLNLLCGLDSIDFGSITINDIEVSKFTEKEWDDYRNLNIGIVFQEYNLISGLSVYENVSLPKKICKGNSVNESFDVLKFVGMDKFKNRKVNLLSGGQKQRVAIARALNKSPLMIIADEPTGNLDSSNSENIYKLLKEIAEKILVVIISHDETAAYKYSDRIIELADGKIIKDISPNKSDYLLDNVGIQIINKEEKKEKFSGFNDKEFHKYITNMLQLQYLKVIEENVSSTNDEQQINYELNLKITKTISESTTRNNESELIIENNVDNTVKPMNINDILKFTLKSISKRKLRLLVTTSMFILTSFLFLMVTIFNFSDYKKTTSEYIKEYNVEYIYPMYEVAYEDLFFRNFSSNISKGDLIHDTVNNNFKSDNIYNVLSNQNINYTNMSGSQNEIFVNSIILNSVNKKNFSVNMIGRYPESDNEIVLTDYVIEKIDYDDSTLDKPIFVEGKSFKIVGVIKTDFREYEIDNKLNSDRFTEYGEYKLNREYLTTILNQSYLDTLKVETEYLEIPRSDFTRSNRLSSFLAVELIYGDIDMISTNQLTKGRLPLEKNEVILSQSFANTLNPDVLEKVGVEQVEFEYIDLHSEELNGFYRDEDSLYNYFSSGVNVVGVYDDVSFGGGTMPDVLINSKKYSEIKEAYFNVYIYSDYMIHLDGRTMTIMNIFDSNDLLINEPNILNIYDFHKTIKQYSIYVSFILVILTFITIFMLVTLISFSIKDSSKMIGILRSLGVRKKNILMIYIFETIIIDIIGITISILIASSALKYVNSAYKEFLSERLFDIIHMNYLAVFAVITFIFVVSGLATIYPINSLSKRKPADIIRS